MFGKPSKLEFQSTPPAEARGDVILGPDKPALVKDVSIHSPRRSEGRHDL